jgi:LysR family hydrogen peroxide-inducible transcriptional activator
MELHQLRYFIAVVDAGTVGRAAERCGIAQPSLSQQLRRLERSLGVDLFDRVGRGLVLTEAGRAFVPRARRVLEEVRAAESSLRDDLEGGPRRASVGAIPTIAPHLLPPVLRDLRSRFPDCAVDVREDRTEALVEAVATMTLDCAVASTPIADERIDVETIGEEELLVAVPRGHRLAHADDVAAAELRDEPVVALDGTHCLGRQIQGFCTARRIAPEIVCSASQIGTIFAMVAAGLGVAIVPAMAAEGLAAADRDARKRPEVVVLRFRSQRPTREIAILWRRDRSRSRVAAAFREAALAWIKGGHSANPRSARRGR